MLQPNNKENSQHQDEHRSDRAPRGRLWVLSECYPSPRGPTQGGFIHRQMAALGKQGWAVRVLRPCAWRPPIVWPLAPSWRRALRLELPRLELRDGVPVERLTYQNRAPSRLCSPRGSTGRIAAALQRYLRARDVRPERDLLLAQFALPHGPAVREAAAALGMRYVVHLRGDDVWRYPDLQGETSRAAFVATVRDASLVLSVADALLAGARERLGEVALPLSTVAPNGVDLQLFRPAESPSERAAARKTFNLQEDELTVISVATPLARKGWLDLLDALHGLAERAGRPLALIALCSREEGDINIAAEAARRAPDVRLILRTELPASEVAEAYRAADIFCLLSHSEGMSNALLEAMASGLPVVATDVCGHPEVVQTGVEGELVAARSASAAHEVLAALATNLQRRRQLGQAARRKAELIGSPQENAARLTALLQAVLQGRLPQALSTHRDRVAGVKPSGEAPSDSALSYTPQESEVSR